MMAEGEEVEDELLDLNKVPVDRKRNRVEKNSSSTNKGGESSDGLPKCGRVLRSRAVPMIDCEKKVAEAVETVNSDDAEEHQVDAAESESESKVPVSRRRKKKAKRGRPPKPKTESKCEVPPLSIKVKRKRGRPPKNVISATAITSKSKEDDKVTESKKVGGSNGSGQDRGLKMKRKRGRPRKTEYEDMGFSINKKIMKTSNGNVGLAKRFKVSTDDIVNSITRMEKATVELADCREQKPLRSKKVATNELENVAIREKKRMPELAQGKGMGLREQKLVIRDQIVSMITKAGWAVEYRQRQSKNYQDAVYVDREGKTYWSVTLAYRKFKEKIDEGKADEKEVSVFSPIPEETFSMLFRITNPGNKGGRKKNGEGKTIKTKTKKTSKRKTSDGGSISRLNKGRRTLLVRKHKDGLDSCDNVYEGKRNLLSWMIDLGTVPLGGRVKYKRGRGRKMLLEGEIMKEGICCDFCKLTHGVWEFVSHAESTSGNPYDDIYLESGSSLFQCLVESWKKHVKNDDIGFVRVDMEGDDPNDDTCNVCGDGGDLICCDNCPSTFHDDCLCVKVPSGDWHCVYCSCKFCGLACESISASDDESDLSSELFACRLCEGKYHVHCMERTFAEDFGLRASSFCGKECYEIFEQLQVLLGVKHELEEGFSYTLHHIVSGDTFLDCDSSKVESNAKLAVGFLVMDECFEPIIDERSGTNMIHNVVYSCGSNIKRLNYDGFYTIILEKGDEVVAAASIRIHGSRLAEMPFIGTRFMYRRQGICGRLLASIEKLLYSLGVEKLVIPAISELNEMWTKVFGFGPLEESMRKETMRMSMIVFPGVDMLQKPLIGNQSTKGHRNSAEFPDVRPENRNTQENVTSATESTQTCYENAQEEIGEDTSGVAAPNSGTSADVENLPNERVSVVESGEIMAVDLPDKAVNVIESGEIMAVNLPDKAVNVIESGVIMAFDLPDKAVNVIESGEIMAVDLPDKAGNVIESGEIMAVDFPDKAVNVIESGEIMTVDLPDKAKSAAQPTEARTGNENPQEQGEDTGGGVAEQSVANSSEVGNHNNEKLAVTESDETDSSDKTDIKVGAVNNGEPSENGDCFSHLVEPKDSDSNLETSRSAEETNACPNGPLPSNEKLENGSGCEDSKGNVKKWNLRSTRAESQA